MLNKLLTAVLPAAILALIAALSVWTQEPWLAPSLGSAAFAQTLSPDHTSAKPYSISVGQLIGLIAGLIGVFVAGATTTPQFMGDHTLVGARVLAVSIAAFLAALAQLLTSATTPAGGATAMVVAIGAETADMMGVIHLIVGILLVTVFGEAARQFLLRLQAKQRARKLDRAICIRRACADCLREALPALTFRQRASWHPLRQPLAWPSACWLGWPCCW